MAGTRSGFKITAASAPIAPFLVPPSETASTPASVVNARSEVPSEAAAFEMRAPSR